MSPDQARDLRARFGVREESIVLADLDPPRVENDSRSLAVRTDRVRRELRTHRPLYSRTVIPARGRAVTQLPLLRSSCDCRLTGSMSRGRVASKCVHAHLGVSRQRDEQAVREGRRGRHASLSTVEARRCRTRARARRARLTRKIDVNCWMTRGESSLLGSTASAAATLLHAHHG